MKILQKTFASVLVSGLLAQGCSRTNELQQLERAYVTHRGHARVEAQFCTTPASEYRQRLKYIFVMDKSSSNQQDPDGTDPQGDRRYVPLMDFLGNVSEDPGYTFYSLINFSDSNRTGIIQPLRTQRFTDVKSQFEQYVADEWNGGAPLDVGYTNYLAALDAVRSLIRADVEQARQSFDPVITTNNYVVVFISDGYPIIQDPNGTNGVSPQPTDQIFTLIDQIRNLKNDSRYRAYIDDISLHTGYYFNDTDRDMNAETLLAQMADRGQGEAHQFGSGKNIDYSLFAVPVRNVKNLLTDVFVENASVTWWDDGELSLDTDLDGLPDRIEDELGSNKEQKDSDGNGVSDFAEFRSKGKPCNDSRCNRRISVRDNYAACSGMMPPTRPDGSANPTPDGVNPSPYGTNWFSDRDKDGLNDCEEWILRADRENFDSNGDFIPDGLSMKSQIPFIAGTTPASGDGDADGLTNYSELKYGSPGFIANQKILGLKPVVYDLNRIDSPVGLDCYRLQVKDLATIGWGNTIRIHVVENTATVDRKPRIRVAQKALKEKDTLIEFARGEFK